MKNFIQKYSIYLLIIGFGLLLLTQQKVIMPLIYDVIKSDLFLVDSNDKASQYAIATPLTDTAFQHCNRYIKSELGTETTVEFSAKPLNAWSLGNYRYIVNAELNVTGPSEAGQNGVKKYVCRIAYSDGEHQENAADFDKWAIEGLSGLEDIGVK